MKFRMRIEHGQDAGKTVRFPGPGIYRFGRGTDLSMRVLDMKVSKAHFELVVGSGPSGPAVAMLRELGSSHGTLINGQPVKTDNPKPIKAGDEIRVGTTILRILSDGAADEDIKPVRQADDAGTQETAGHHTEDHSETATRLPPDELVGKQLGGYRIIQKIGKGGMGAVYLAEQVSLHRQVALKVLSDKFATDSAFVDQFLNEARAAGALNHPNVVQVYDVGEAQKHYYFSMEFVTGGSIEDKVRKSAEYSWQDALNWFIDATNALVFAQRKDILHRDVKPDNLMLAEDGSAKLCDLGLAKRSENQDLLDQGIIGTPHFISPEAIRRKTAIDQRTDLYSLGCTFFRILAGENPYPGKTVKEILLGHLNKPVPHVTEHNDAIPRELDEIVHKLMQKEPDARYQDASELQQALDKVRVKHGLEAHGIKTGSRKVLIGAIAGLVVAIAAAVFFMTQDPEVVIENVPIATVYGNAESEFTGLKGGLAERSSEMLRDSTELEREFTTGNIEKSWESNKAKWTTLAERFTKLADDAKEQLYTWEGEQEKKISDLAEKANKVLKHKEAPKNPGLRDKAAGLADALADEYDEAIADVRKIEKRAREYADEKITAYVKRREDNKEREEQKRNESLDGFRTFVQTLAAGVQKSIDEGQPWDAEKSLDPKLIEKKIDGAYNEAQVDGAFVVERDELVAIAVEILGRTVDEEGKVLKDWGVAKWIDPALKKIVDTHEKRIKEAQAFSGAGDIDGYKKAIQALEKYLEELPTPPADAKGRIAERLRDNRKTAERQLATARKKLAELEQAQRSADIQAYQRLVILLRAPEVNGKAGAFGRFDFTSAINECVTAARAAKTDEYKGRIAVLERDARALANLFTRLVEAFSKDGDEGWSDTGIYIVDDKGKDRRKRVKEAGSTQLILSGGDAIGLRQLGILGVIDRLLFYREQPRIQFAGDDFRALAVLAEMAGDSDRAKAWWTQYGTDKPDANDRIGALPQEMGIARTWYELAGKRSEIDTKLSSIDPEVIGWDKFFSQKMAEEIELVRRDVAVLLGECQDLRATLGEAAKAGKTLWALSLRGR